MKGTQGLIREIASFNQQDFQEWIWQRTHGIDRMTSITTIRDPNPFHALLDGYGMLADKTDFCVGLMASLRRSIDTCHEAPKENLTHELVALKRHLLVLSRIEEQDVPLDAGELCDECYNLVFETLPSNFVQPIALSVCARIGASISDQDLVGFLQREQFEGVAFVALVRKQGIQAVGKYFAQYAKTAKRKAFIKITIGRLKKQFGQALKEQIETAKQQLPNELREIIDEAMAE